MAKYVDLKISKYDDLATDDARAAELVLDVDVIAQDVKHMIRESGYLVAMIGERNPDRRRLLLQQISMLVEEDTRIVPGTVEITDDGSLKRWTLSAETYEFGRFTHALEVTNA